MLITFCHTDILRSSPYFVYLVLKNALQVSARGKCTFLPLQAETSGNGAKCFKTLYSFSCSLYYVQWRLLTSKNKSPLRGHVVSWRWLTTMVQKIYKGWKFLRKLWCCVGGGNKVIWLYHISWKCKLATVTS